MRRTADGSTTKITVYAFGLEEHHYQENGGSSVTETGTTHYYSAGGMIIGMLSGTTTMSTTFLLTDTLGSVVARFSNTAGSSQVLGNQLYGPYGNQRYKQGEIGTDKGYTGQYNDNLTGLNYYGARYYDPVIGRFVSADTKEGNPQGTDPYAYVTGNPQTMNDPTGHSNNLADIFMWLLYQWGHSTHRLFSHPHYRFFQDWFWKSGGPDVANSNLKRIWDFKTGSYSFRIIERIGPGRDRVTFGTTWPDAATMKAGTAQVQRYVKEINAKNTEGQGWHPGLVEEDEVLSEFFGNSTSRQMPFGDGTVLEIRRPDKDGVVAYRVVRTGYTIEVPFDTDVAPADEWVKIKEKAKKEKPQPKPESQLQPQWLEPGPGSWGITGGNYDPWATNPGIYDPWIPIPWSPWGNIWGKSS